MHLASIINKLTFVVEAFFGELGDFFGVSGVEDDGRRRYVELPDEKISCGSRKNIFAVILFGHDLQGIVARGRR